VLRVSSVWSSFVDYWTVRFSGQSCASCFKCSEFVRRLLDFSVLREELCFVLQVFRVRSSIIELFGFQGRAVLRVSIVWSSFVDYWNVRFSRESCASLFKCLELVRRLMDCSILRGELRFMFQVFGDVYRLLDCSVLRGELRFVFQVFGSICVIIGLIRSQREHCFVFGWDFAGLTELFQLFVLLEEVVCS